MAYGMTEQLGLSALRGDEWLTHQGSVGRGFRGTEIQILDAAQNPVPVGDYGDVYMRSPATGGYDYLGGAPLLPTTADGFGTAGDMGRLDEEGYLYLADRRVDMIVTGGANVFPAEVEAVLSEHPGIADAVVVGLADPEWGRRVHAIVERGPAGARADRGGCHRLRRRPGWRPTKRRRRSSSSPRSRVPPPPRSAALLW